MNCSNSSDRLKPSVAPPSRSFLVLLADGSRLRVTCRDLAAQLRQERSVTLMRLRQARSEALAAIADRVSESRIRRDFEANERRMDAAIRRMSKQVRVKPEPRQSSTRSRSIRSAPVGTGHSGMIITRSTNSALARRDRLGREGIMLRIRYVRAGGKHAGVGCLRRHWRYITREAAVTLDSEGRQIVLGNLGETIEEIAAALDLQEQVLREMRKNAKLGFRMVGAFPYDLPVDARREALQRIGDEVFGMRGLSWTGASHDGDPEASVDNPHFHLDYSLLLMARQADGSFIISNDLRTDLDGQEGLRFIRHSVARIMTEVAQEYGLERTFTALSYRERGMNREGGEHVGQEATAAHRRGEHVASVARNAVKQRIADAREKAGRARTRIEVLKQLQRAIAAVPAAPSLSISTPRIGKDVTMPTPVIAHALLQTEITPTDLVPVKAFSEGVQMPIITVEAPPLSRSPSFRPDVFKPAAGVTAVPVGTQPSLPPAAPVPQMPQIRDTEPALAMSRVPLPVMTPTIAPALAAMPSVVSVAAIKSGVDAPGLLVPQIDGPAPQLSAPPMTSPPFINDVGAQLAPAMTSTRVSLPVILPVAAPSMSGTEIGIADIAVAAPTNMDVPPVTAFAAALTPMISDRQSATATASFVPLPDVIAAAAPVMASIPMVVATTTIKSGQDFVGFPVPQIDGTEPQPGAPQTKSPRFANSIEAGSVPAIASGNMPLPRILPDTTPSMSGSGMVIVTDIGGIAPSDMALPTVTALPAAPRVIRDEPSGFMMSIVPLGGITSVAAPVMASIPTFVAVTPITRGNDIANLPVRQTDDTVPQPGAPKVTSPPVMNDIEAELAPAVTFTSVPLPIILPAAAPLTSDRGIDIVTDIAGAAATDMAVPTVTVFARAPNLYVAPPVAADIGRAAPVAGVVPTDNDPVHSAPTFGMIDLPHIDADLAPYVDKTPAPSAIDDAVTDGVALPTITLIEPPIRYPAVAGPAIWDIGRPISSDADDEQTEKRLMEIVDRETERHRDAKRRAADEQRKQEVVDAMSRTVADVTTGALVERQRQIAEACRILSRSPLRPYRIVGERVFLDLAVMGRREADAVSAVGLEVLEVADALIARVRRDRAEDKRIQADGQLPPLSRLTVLGCIADEYEATTRTWVASCRIADQTPAAIGATDNDPSKRRSLTGAALAAAMLNVRQRE